MSVEVKKLNSLYYNEPLEKRQKDALKEQKKKEKDREKRIKEKQKNLELNSQEFDFETETVIGMTNKNNQRKRQMLQKKLEQQEKQKQKRRKRIMKIVKWTTILGLLAGGIAFALLSPIFNIQEVQVVGNSIIPTDTIISLSQLSKDQNIFKFINLQIEQQIKDHPYVDKVTVKRILPSTVQIQVQERERNFNIQFMNEYAYINNQGYILEISDSKLELPTIQGITMPEEEIKPGNRLKTEDLEKLETVIQLMIAWKNNNMEQSIDSIDITNKNEYSIRIEEEKKTVYLGDKSNLSNKVLWIQAIINDNKGIEGEIYVNGDLNNNFRPRFKQKV